MDERVYLKVKLKSLAEEAKIIRKETERAKLRSIKHGLYAHRTRVVRPEARYTHLAYGFLRGREYRQMEQKARLAPDWKRVRKMVQKYGSHIVYSYDYDLYRERKEAAKKHLDEALERFDKWVEKANEQLQEEEAQRSQENKMESQTGA